MLSKMYSWTKLIVDVVLVLAIVDMVVIVVFVVKLVLPVASCICRCYLS